MGRIVLLAIAAFASACSSTAPQVVDHYCTKTRQQQVNYGSHVVVTSVCTEWTLQPTRQQRDGWERRSASRWIND